MYKVIRFFANGGRKQILAKGLTLEQAQEWCKDVESSSKTCRWTTALKRTKRRGEWFEGFVRM